MSREEVSAMVDVGTTEGIFRESESKLIKSCIALSGVKARQIMTPSIVVESACQDLTVKDFQAKKSWIPVKRLYVRKLRFVLLVFHLVEDIGSWDAENEGKSLFLQFK